MIRYALSCTEGHKFESWFASAEAFDDLSASGHLSCAVCGSGAVEKSLMSPSVRPEAATLSTPRTEAERALAAMRRHVEANSEYVGLSFAQEARAIHDGASPMRAIHGEAKVEEARKLIEEGVPVAPLPFLPKSRAN